MVAIKAVLRDIHKGEMSSIRHLILLGAVDPQGSTTQNTRPDKSVSLQTFYLAIPNPYFLNKVLARSLNKNWTYSLAAAIFLLLLSTATG